MQKVSLILFLVLQSVNHVLAQKAIEIRGTVKDSSGVALTSATIQVFTAFDTSSVFSKVDGSFHLRIPQSASFEIVVSMQGYTAFKKIYEPGNFAYLFLPTIILHPTYRELSSVLVQHIKPINVRRDTIDYHALAFRIGQGAELERLLKKLPGLEVSRDGTLRFLGKKITRIMVDGKSFPADILTAIRNLPADIIDIIQVVDDYGDKSKLIEIKSEESEKVLNIILKKDCRNGKFGQLRLAVGNKNKYEGIIFSDIVQNDRQLVLNGWLRNIDPTGNNFEKGGHLGYAANYGKKWSGSTSVDLSGDNHSSGMESIEDNYSSGSQIHSNRTSQNVGNNLSLIISDSILFMPTQNTTLRIVPSLNSSRSNETISSDFNNFQKDSGFIKMTTGYSFTRNNFRNLTAGADIYFENRFVHSKNKFSIQSSYRYFNRQEDNGNFINTNIQTNELHSVSKQYYLVNTANDSRDFNTRLNYYIATGKKSFLELSYSWHFLTTQNTVVTHIADSIDNTTLPIDSLSNDYSFQTTTQRFHAGYIIKLDKLNIALSLDAQPLTMSGKTDDKKIIQDFRYFNIVPLVRTTYFISEQGKLSFEYASDLIPPEFKKLQPVTDLSKPQYPVTGNPNLKSSFSHVFGLKYEQFFMKARLLQNLNVSLKYNTISDMVIPSITYSNDTTSYIAKTGYQNSNGFYLFSADYLLHFKAFVRNRLRIMLNGNLEKNKIPTIVDGLAYGATSLEWGQGVSLNLDIPEIIESELSGYYSINFSRYAFRGGTNVNSYATWGFNNRHTVLQKWLINYSVYQFFTSGANGRLVSNPAVLNASIERRLLKNNQATLRFSAVDLFNKNTGVSQTVTPTSVLQTRSALLGRYYLLNLILKFQQFKQ